jgi:uncharacterized repeat protein (TIGR02543 family)
MAGQCTILNGAANGQFCEINVTATTAGAYKIISTNGTSSSLNYEVKVSDSSDNEITGRTWTKQIYLMQSCSMVEYASNGNSCGIPDGSVTPPVDYVSGSARDLTLYAVNDAGNIYEINLYQYQGISSQILLDAAGNVATAGTCDSAYISQGRSADDADAIPGDPIHLAQAANCAKYRLFFEPPNVDLPVSAQSADGLLQVLPVAPNPSATSVADLQPSLDTATLVSSLQFVESQTATNKAGTLQFDLSPNFSGNYTIQVDVNNNGDYDDAIDYKFSSSAPGGAENTNIQVTFGGKNGQGADISPNQTIKFRIKFDRLAETHLNLLDLERLGGLTITAINGTNAGDSTVYWDDTELVQYTDGSTIPWTTTLIVDGRAGVDSAVAGGVHGWEYGVNPRTGRATSSNAWGDNRYIDTWVYLQTDIASNLTVTADAMYTVDFVSNGGTSVSFQKVVPADTATEPSEPTRERFDFECWYLTADFSGDCYDFDAPVTTNITLYAKWTEDAKCEYNDSIYADDESCIKPDEPIVPTEPTDPDEPVPGKPDTGIMSISQNPIVIILTGFLVLGGTIAFYKKVI